MQQFSNKNNLFNKNYLNEVTEVLTDKGAVTAVTLCLGSLGQSGSGPGPVVLLLFLVEPAEGEDVFGSVSVV